jgi:hypothetical protein
MSETNSEVAKRDSERYVPGASVVSVSAMSPLHDGVHEVLSQTGL